MRVGVRHGHALPAHWPPSARAAPPPLRRLRRRVPLASQPAHTLQHTLQLTLQRTLQRRIRSNDRILLVQEKWLDKIFSGEKSLEIRPIAGRNTVLGKRIYLCQSGTKAVVGYAVVSHSLGPLGHQAWEDLRAAHRVEGGRMYGDHTFAWRLQGVTRLKYRVRIERNVGSVGIQVGPGW